MKRWEYLVEDVSMHGRRGSILVATHSAQERLDMLGARGWELVSCVFDEDGDPRAAVLKREVAAPAAGEAVVRLRSITGA